MQCPQTEIDEVRLQLKGLVRVVLNGSHLGLPKDLAAKVAERIAEQAAETLLSVRWTK